VGEVKRKNNSLLGLSLEVGEVMSRSFLRLSHEVGEAAVPEARRVRVWRRMQPREEMVSLAGSPRER
jgi:hypothetical protein